MHIDNLPTPALLLDREILCRNLDFMAARARSLGVALRPHVKTHKCVEIARMQRERGARGLTVSTLTEAEIFAGAGFDELTYAFPLEPGKIDWALALAERVTLRVTVDNLPVAEALEAIAARRNQAAHVWLKVDCGYHRAGVDPATGYASHLARFLHEAPHIVFDGLLTHAGHAYRAASREELLAIAEQERAVPVNFAERLRAEGIAVPAVSVGSTPTMSVVSDLAGAHEIRPGNYVFYDRTQVALGSCQLADCALTVLAAVVSHQPGSDLAVVDAGALALSHDPGPSHLDEEPVRGAVLTGSDPVAVHPSLRVVSLSQEHGIVQGSGSDDLVGLNVGSRLRILPNHSCLTAALFDEYVVVKGSEVVNRWKIMRARS